MVKPKNIMLENSSSCDRMLIDTYNRMVKKIDLIFLLVISYSSDINFEMLKYPSTHTKKFEFSFGGSCPRAPTRDGAPSTRAT